MGSQRDRVLTPLIWPMALHAITQMDQQEALAQGNIVECGTHHKQTTEPWTASLHNLLYGIGNGIVASAGQMFT